jgi:P-type Cu+ transporter
MKEKVKSKYDLQVNLYGMTCANCALRIEKGLHKIDGVENVNVNLALETGTIFLNTPIDPEVLIQSIENMGYGASLMKDKSSQTNEDESKREDLKKKNFIKLMIGIFLSLPLFLSMFSHSFHQLSFFHYLANPYLQLLLASPVQFYIGFHFHKGAFYSIRDKMLGMDLLVSIGTSASYFYSIYLGFFKPPGEHLYFETSSLLITFVLLGKYLEEKAKHKSSSAIKNLLELKPKTALVIRDTIETEIPIENVSIDDICLIKPGSLIPSDGTVIEGSSDVDETLLTGESNYVYKKIGDPVFGATMNLSGYLKIKITSLGESTVLSKIISIVSNAQSSKAPIQRLADKISAVFVPVILFISFLSFFMHYFWLHPGIYSIAFESTISVLVIACPCALGLATPASIMSGSGKSAEYGILFRNAEALEIAHKCKTIVFDKTGTLTEGKPSVVGIYPAKGISDSSLILKACIAEKFSSHPIANTILDRGKSLSYVIPDPDSFEYIPGIGASVLFEGKTIKASSLKYASTLDIESNKELFLSLQNKGETCIVIYENEKYLGTISLYDNIKETSLELILKLKRSGIHIVMLTGDSEKTANKIGQTLGINEIISEVKPDEKASVIRKLQKNKNLILMVGDGINDAPALATADVGVAMGSGSDIAIETADVTIIRNNMKSVADILFFSQKTYKNIQQNLFWALGYNSLGIPLAAFGYLSPWIAGFAMALSSISVVLNAIRLQKLKPSD